MARNLKVLNHAKNMGVFQRLVVILEFFAKRSEHGDVLT